MRDLLLNFKPYKLNFEGVRLPEIKISDEERKSLNIDQKSDNYTYLNKLCENGFNKKLEKNIINLKDKEKYIKRYQYELEVVKKNNLTDYFLLVYDILHWCDINGIARGVSRGSASGSLVFYLLECSNIDPVRYLLPFSRFISEARLQSQIIDNIVYLNGKTMPDYDADVSYKKRQNVIDYINTKYNNKTSKIITTIKFSGKILIKDVVKTFLEYSESQSMDISSLIDRHFGKVEKLSEAYENNKDFKKWADLNKECFDIACSLESLPRAAGQHPSGIAISFSNIDEFIPLELSTGKEIVTSYDMEDVATIMVKLDVLGLKNCDINYEVCQLLGLDYKNININDPEIYEFLKTNSNYFGLFQIEIGLTRKTVQEVKPRDIDELACCLSLSRPGVYEYIPDYIKYVQNGEIKKIHPLIDKTLEKTAGIIVFQEQVTQLCVEVFGMNEIDADQIRYCIGKKKKDDILKWQPVIFEQGQKKNIPKDVIELVWKTIQDSADYQFCKNHAYAYAAMTATNAFLKKKYPKEFFLCLLNMAKEEANTSEIISQITPELNSFGIKLLSPHILKSGMSFTIEGDNLRFSLAAVKGIAEKSLEKLRNFCHDYSNKFEIFTAATESKLPIFVLNSLISAGALDDYLTDSRTRTVLESQTYNLLTDREKKRIIEIGKDFNYNLINILKYLKLPQNGSDKPFLKESRVKTIRKEYTFFQKMYDQNSKNEDLNSYIHEKTLLGYSYSHNLFNILKKSYPDIEDISECLGELDDTKVVIGGELSEFKSGTSKNKNKYLKASIYDGFGKINIMMMENGYLNNKKVNQFEINNELNNDKKLEDGNIVVCVGRKSKDIVFCDKIVIQDYKIIQKISEIKKESDKIVE